MRIKNLHNAGFSLLEILLASIIFIISVGGIFATLNAVRTPVVTKESSLTAAIFGKQVLEALRSQVQDPQSAAALKQYYNCSTNTPPCPDFALSVGVHAVPVGNLPTGLSWPASLTAANGGANPVLNYIVTCADGNSADCATDKDVAHEVNLNIQW